MVLLIVVLVVLMAVVSAHLTFLMREGWDCTIMHVFRGCDGGSGGG
jgi:hypothetical protein